jgi:DNA-binding winged helix-turn-helix (wHTH) protein
MNYSTSVRAAPERRVFRARSGTSEVVVYEGGSVLVNDSRVRLTPKERDFLETLARAEGQVVTTRMLLHELYASSEPHLKILDIFAFNIRKKLGRKNPSAKHVLRRVWGRGFAFGEPSRLAAQAPDGFPKSDNGWRASTKACIIDALQHGYSTKAILAYYPDLSSAELEEWVQAFEKYGEAGLHATMAQECAL